MNFPGIAAAAPPEKKAGEAGGQEGQDADPGFEEEVVDDGLTPEQRRKAELESDSDFKKYLMMYRMKIPLINIRNKVASDAKYAKSDIDVSRHTHRP